MQSMTSGDTEVLFDYDAMGNLTKLYQNVRGAALAYNYGHYGVGTMSNIYTYTNDKIASITHNGFTYNFTYDEWGNQTSIKIGENIYQSYEYDANNDYRLSKINYANGQSVTYSYDSDDNITGVSYNNGQTYAYVYEYDNDGNLQKIYDNKTGLVTTYSENAVEIKNISDNSVVYSSVTNEDGTETEIINGFDITYSYNSEYNQVTGKTTTSKSLSKEYISNFDFTQYNTDMQVSTTRDWFDRIESKNISIDMQKYCEDTGPHEDYIATGTQTFTYADTETTASTEITCHSASYVWNGNNFFSKTEYYEYDDSGNITGIYRIEDGQKVYYHQYTYDTAGQMYSEYNYLRDEYIIYLYDFSGNITTKNIYPGCYNGLTHMCDVADVAYEYSYEDDGWGDKLTNYNYFDPYLLKPRVYYPITYDAMGNMTSFNGSTMTWTAGRQLATLTDADGAVYSFTYNENGYLSKIIKSVDGAVKYTEHYTWNGDKLINYRKENGWVDESYILYDENGEAYGLIRNEIMVYLFNRNLQGDITEIIEPDFGFVGAEYHYDAYGNYVVKDPESSWYSGDIHAKYVDDAVPFTYRGYLDINIGDYHLYYLGSRFYSPQLGRFLNADDINFVGIGSSPISCNIFTYCNNNPVMRVDPLGTISFRQGIYAYTNINDCFDPDDYIYNPKLSPTLKNRFMLSSWKTLATMIKRSCPDGYAFYMHYITGNGKAYFYDYSKAIKEDVNIRKTIDGMINDFKFYIKQQNLQDGITYEFSSILDKDVGVTNPKTLNWKLALGTHLIVMTAKVKYFKSEHRYNAIIVIGAYDRYNFKSSDKFMELIPGSWNGELVACGLAKNYTSCGLAFKSVSWR